MNLTVLPSRATLCRMKTLLHHLLHLLILSTFALTGVWMRFPGAPTAFHPFYVMGFLIFWPLIACLVLWLLLGAPGLRDLWLDRRRRFWMLALLLLAGWALLSWAWAYTSSSAVNRPGASLAASIPFVLVLLFALVTACAGPSIRWIAAALILSAVVSGSVGGLQVALQASSGLGRFGELTLDPQLSGVAVVQADGLRWLRAYGLLPHPNILAGLLVVGVLATVGWALQVPGPTGSGRKLFLPLGVLVLLLWLLGLTFSRSAWVGLAAAGGIFLLLVWRRVSRRRLIVLGGVALLTGLAFTALYFPFLSARVAATESIEQRSIADRIVYSDMAWQAIEESPILGWGMGNFPWRASYYLTFTNFDLRGQQVHHIYLAAWAELGIIGLGIFLAALILGLTASIRQPAPITNHQPPVTRFALLAALLAWAVIGWFDHYPWTIFQMQIVCWGLLGALQPQHDPTKIERHERIGVQRAFTDRVLP
jgi:O-antigen ligase